MERWVVLPKGIAFRCDQGKTPPQAPPEAPAGGEENFAVSAISYIRIFTAKCSPLLLTQLVAHIHMYTQ